MKNTVQLFISCFSLAALVTACGDRQPGSEPVIEQSAASVVPATSPAPVTDQWLGKWIGPEGTFLQLSGGQGAYEVKVQNLDGPRTFQGNAVGNQIEFERDGKKEFIHASNGAETGMKWLSDKADCLTVQLGEGYCRD